MYDRVFYCFFFFRDKIFPRTVNMFQKHPYCETAEQDIYVAREEAAVIRVSRYYWHMNC